MDAKSTTDRSKNMAAVHSKDTRPEIFVRSTLHRLGFRFRIHRKDLSGKPDIVLPKHRIIIFVDGCFWHSHHGCKKSKLPTSNVEFWRSKISKNISRDQEVNFQLLHDGWRVLRVWECALKSTSAREAFPTLLKNWINSSQSYGEIPEAQSSQAKEEAESAI